MRLLPLRVATSVAACLLVTSFASAQVTTTWVGGVSGDWNDSLNWIPLTPTAADTAVIPPGTANNAIVIFGDAICGSLQINSGAVIGIEPGRRLTVFDNLTVLGSGQIDAQPTGELHVGNNLTASSAAVFNGLEEIVLDQDGSVSSGSSLLPPLRIIGGIRTLATGRCQSLFIDQSLGQLPTELRVNDASTFTVEGDAYIGEALTSQASGGTLRVLQVNGTTTWDVPSYPMGTQSNALLTLRCNGDYEANTGTTIEQGWVELGGAGTAVIRSAFGSSDLAVFRNLRIAAGTRLLENKNVRVLGECEVRTATFDLDWPETLEVQGTLDTNWPDALLTNDPLGSPEQPVRLTGSGDLRGGTTPLPAILVEEAQITNRGATVSNLTMNGNGSVLTMADGTTLRVTGDYVQNGGTLAYQASGGTSRVLRVDGEFRQFGGSVSSSNAANFIDAYGDWNSVAGFVMDSGWVRFKGSGELTGVNPHIRRMRLESGIRTILTDVEVSAELLSVGGATDGSGWIEMVGATQPVNTGANLIKRLRVVSNTIDFFTSRVEELEMTGGILRIRDGRTLNVDGNAVLTGGQLASESSGGTQRGLDIAGDCSILGAVAAAEQNSITLHRVAGNWASDGGFSMGEGWLALDGVGSTTLGGPSPTFGNLRIQNGTRALVSPLLVEGELEVRSNLDAAEQDVEVQGSLDTNWVGANFVGTGPVRLTGDGELRTNTTPIPPVLLESGTRQVFTSSIEAVNVAGGIWRTRDGSMCTVSGDVVMAAGEHSSDPSGGTLRGFDVAGSLVQTGTVIGTTNSTHRIRVAGDWSSESGFSMANGWVELDGGDAFIGGGDPEFKRLRLVSGTKTLNSDVEVYGELLSVGGSTDGTGWMELTDALTPVSTGANSIGRLRVVSGTIPFFTTRIGDLEMTGGVLRVRDAITVTVDGNALLTGGELASQASGGTLRGLDIAGDCTILGATAAAEQNFITLHRVGGNWSSDSGFSMDEGWFTLDGAGNTTIGGPSPTFGNVRIENGTRTAAASVVVERELEVRADLDAADQDIEIQGTLDTNWSGATFVGTGPARLTGDGELRTNSNSILPLRLESGTRQVFTSWVDGVEVTGGTWRTRDGSMCTVAGDVLMSGGVHSSDPGGGTLRGFDVEGDWIQSGTSIGSTNSTHRISVAGNWSSQTGFSLASGWVYLDGGDSEIGGSSEFNRLRLDSGVKTLISDAEVFGQLLATGGSTSGEPWLVLTGSSAAVSSGSNLINRLRVASGSVPFSTTRVGDLQLTGGTLTVNDGITVTIDRNVEFLGGTYQTQASGGTSRGLDVAGNFTAVGTVVGSQNNTQFIRVAGDWASNATFAPTSGVVELDGLGTTSISGSLPGLDPRFGTLRIKNGVRQFNGELAVMAGLLDVDPGATLACPQGAVVEFTSTPVQVDGTLSVFGGGELLADSTSSLTVNSVGRLEVLGSPGMPARLGGHAGGGYSCFVSGTLAARDFDIGGGNEDGLRFAGSLAPAPNDLRGGLFRDPAVVPGATLVTLEQGVSISPLFVSFENANPMGQVNARRTTGNPVTFGNFGGEFAGEDFEDDPNDLIEWVPGLETQLDFFAAKNGPEQAFLSWSTNLEVNVDRFVVESGPTDQGPFLPIAELLGQGSGNYSLTDSPLAADVEQHYRLLELQTDGFLRLLGTANATPYSAALPANIRTVGVGQEFATIQEAIDAASDLQTVIRISSGSYPAFTIDAPGVESLTLVPEDGASVNIDASGEPLTVRNLALGQDVVLADLTVNGGSATEAVRLQNNLGALILEDLSVSGGTGQPGLVATGNTGVSVQGGLYSGTPGVAAVTSFIYVGRSTVDALDLFAGAVARECDNSLGATNVDGTSVLTSYVGAQPELSGPRFGTLGQATAIQLEASPMAFYQLGVAGKTFPLDLQDPDFWQMLFLLDFSSYSVLQSGFTDGAGTATLEAEIPPQALFLGKRFLLQAWTLQAIPTAEVRFSGALPVIAVP